MLRIRNYFIAFAVVFAISSAYALIGIQDAKAQESGAYTDLVKRIEALESKGGGNVFTGARKLKIGLQVRTRFEYQKQFLINTGATRAGNIDSTGGVFRLTTPANTTKGAGDSHVGYRESNEFTVQRLRLTFDYDVNKNVRAFAMISDNRTFGSEQSTLAGTGFANSIHMTEGYVDLRNLGDLSSALENVTVRVGRWQMFYGDHRLIGHLNWTNSGRAWDGARVKWDNKKGDWADFFFTSVQQTDTGANAGDFVTPSKTFDRDELFWGIYSHFKDPFGVEGLVAEPYLIVRDRSSSDRKDALAGGSAFAGEDERYSVGLRLVGKKIPSLPGFDFTAEQTWQFGETQTSVKVHEDIQAFAGAWGAGYTFSDAPWTPRIGYQYAFASGDDRPGAGSAKTFSQLYPTGHARLGYIDFHGWMNIRAHKIAFSAKPSKKLLLKADLWFFEADEEADNWYSVAGGVNRIGGDSFVHSNGATGSIDEEYGQELDITAKYKLFNNFGVVAGYSHYFTGDFMEDTNNDTGRDSDWVYLMTSLKF